MDYEVFFDELRECHLANGLPFEYEWPLRVYMMIKNTANCYSVCNKKSKPNKMPKSYGVSAGNKYFNFPPVPSLSKANKNAPTIRDFKYNQDRREIYRIALELARKIGRLPDSLHNRMVLATDRHPAILAYMDEFGA
jgi:hypothetical protein